LGFDYFSPIDESSHFAFVHSLATTGKIPLVITPVAPEIEAMSEHVYPDPPATHPSTMGVRGVIYEAQQPPLYYIVAAPVYNLAPGNLIVKLYALRLLGVGALLVHAFFLVTTYRFLTSREVLPSSNSTFFSVAILLTLIPGCVLRMATVSNAHLLIPLESGFFYFLTRLIFEKRLGMWRHIVPVGLVSGALVLTQNMAAFVVPLAVAVVLERDRSIGRAVLVLVIAAAMLVPWVVFNLLNYGQITGYEVATYLLRPIVNPNAEYRGLAFALEHLGRLNATFWNPEEHVVCLEPYQTCVGFAGVSTMFAAGLGLVGMIGLCRSLRNKKPIDRLSFTLVIYTAAVCLIVLTIVAITIHDSWDSIIGRYVLQVSLPLSFLIYSAMWELSPRLRRVLVCSGVILASGLWVCCLSSIVAERVFRVG